MKMLLKRPSLKFVRHKLVDEESAMAQVMRWLHYSDVTISAMASEITSISSVSSTVGSDAHQRKYQSSASLAFVRGIPRWPIKLQINTFLQWTYEPVRDWIQKDILLILLDHVCIT